VHWSALVASPSGTVDAAPFQWSFCLDPKPLDENNAIATSCLGDGAPAGGPSPSLDAALPTAGCSLFGPDQPPSMPGQPPLRPRDPDVTGGYYQPLLADLAGGNPDGSDLLGVALERITCDLANAPIDVARDFATQYQPNQNPSIAAVLGAPDGATLQPVEAMAPIPAGAHATFEVQFADGSAETFPVYDPTARALTDQREALRVSWFAAGGAFDHDHTGRGADETDLFTDDGWTAPSSPGAIPAWVVLRDSRGGVDFRAFTIVVQ
jgi:hypothetical protein